MSDTLTYSKRIHLSLHTAWRCAKILYFCAKTCSIFKDSSALSVWLCTLWHAKSILILRLIKCGYNQGLIVYWSPLWDTRVLNNAIPWASMQQQSPFILPASGAGDCCWVVIWFGMGQPGLSPPPDSSDSAEPSQLTCFALTHLFSFLLIKWSDKVGALSHYKPLDTRHIKWTNMQMLPLFMELREFKKGETYTNLTIILLFCSPFFYAGCGSHCTIF